ncbi:hypothetical protein NVV94_05275 [Pseudomonas sp. LS1212]|uniref:hypothetical protein n=1 Tax=Pseudomonas sp. LS1212 TaxID=2972478 RepID=UPI00215BBCE9|nr:hypothetical protein [Pseudomonas sp. LS1212]UVJ44995.1 hypothetical protein NVV94_05275 [Pseudomonas sp. LS1212]
MNTTNELSALIDRVRDGDLEALTDAVELGEQMLLMQELASAPSGIRDEALAANRALWKKRRYSAKRSKLTIENNKRATAKCKALVDEAIEAKKARLKKEERCHWTSTLMDQYFAKKKITIDEETVRRFAYEFDGF